MQVGRTRPCKGELDVNGFTVNHIWQCRPAVLLADSRDYLKKLG